MDHMKCLRCGGKMERDGTSVIEKAFAFNGWLPMYRCSLCGKVEFFQTDRDAEISFSTEDVQNKFCNHCQQCYDAKYPHCPWCGK